jgi:hypothetical protein
MLPFASERLRLIFPSESEKILIRAIFGASHVFSRQGLVVERSRLGSKAGVRGASLLAQDALFDADRISRITRRRAG